VRPNQSLQQSLADVKSRNVKLESTNSKQKPAAASDRKTGWVTSARMEKSTGSKVLDDAAVEAFSKWRFKPGAVPRVHSRITFTVRQKPKI